MLLCIVCLGGNDEHKKWIETQCCTRLLHSECDKIWKGSHPSTDDCPFRCSNHDADMTANDPKDDPSSPQTCAECDTPQSVQPKETERAQAVERLRKMISVLRKKKGERQFEEKEEENSLLSVIAEETKMVGMQPIKVKNTKSNGLKSPKEKMEYQRNNPCLYDDQANGKFCCVNLDGILPYDDKTGGENVLSPGSRHMQRMRKEAEQSDPGIPKYMKRGKDAEWFKNYAGRLQVQTGPNSRMSLLPKAVDVFDQLAHVLDCSSTETANHEWERLNVSLSGSKDPEEKNANHNPHSDVMTGPGGHDADLVAVIQYTPEITNPRSFQVSVVHDVTQAHLQYQEALELSHGWDKEVQRLKQRWLEMKDVGTKGGWSLVLFRDDVNWRRFHGVGAGEGERYSWQIRMAYDGDRPPVKKWEKIVEKLFGKENVEWV